MNLFRLNRHEDKTAISGTGIVAMGVIFPSGKVVIEWRKPYCNIGIYNNIEDVRAVHGHDGSTTIEWITPDNPPDDDDLR